MKPGLEDCVQAAMLLSAPHVAVRYFAWREPGEEGGTRADALEHAARSPRAAYRSGRTAAGFPRVA